MSRMCVYLRWGVGGGPREGFQQPCVLSCCQRAVSLNGSFLLRARSRLCAAPGLTHDFMKNQWFRRDDKVAEEVSVVSVAACVPLALRSVAHGDALSKTGSRPLTPACHRVGALKVVLPGQGAVSPCSHGGASIGVSPPPPPPPPLTPPQTVPLLDMLAQPPPCRRPVRRYITVSTGGGGEGEDVGGGEL